MGLNLQREPISAWLAGLDLEQRTAFLERLQAHVGAPVDLAAWTVTDNAYPRVGSYTSYGVFRLALRFVTEGDFADELEPDEEVEREALEEFRAHLKPNSAVVPYAAHFLGTGDTDTLFIPILFDLPFEYDELFVASLPAAIHALEDFARALKFDLKIAVDSPNGHGKLFAIATAKNVARILYGFFTEKPNACIALA